MIEFDEVIVVVVGGWWWRLEDKKKKKWKEKRMACNKDWDMLEQVLSRDLTIYTWL